MQNLPDSSSTDKELVERTFKPLFDLYGVSTKTDTFSSLVQIVLSDIADPGATAVVLKSIAVKQIKNILQMNDHASKNYNLYMERAWGRGYVFTVSQSIDDYIFAFRNCVFDFEPSVWVEFVFREQDIWRNDDMKSVLSSIAEDEL